MHDIQQREQLEHALSHQRNHLGESEPGLRLVLESVKDCAISLLDTEGRVISWNTAAERITGYPEGEILGQHFSRFYSAEAVAKGTPDEYLREAAATGKVEEEGLRLRKNGTGFWAKVLITALRDERGKLIGFCKLTRDITNHKQTEQKLRRSETYLAEGQKISHTGSWAWNVASDEIFWSPEHFRVFGLDPEQAVPSLEAFLQMIHNQDRAAYKQAFETAVLERIEFENEYRLVRPDGSIRHVHSLAGPVFNESGDLIEYVGTVIDITERKQAEASLRDANKRVEIVLDSITDNFFGLSKDWRYTYLNKQAAEQIKALGKDPVSLIGKVLWEVFPDVPAEASLRRVMSERVAVTDELYYPPLGEWVENHIYPSDDGGLAIFQKYVTERKRTEQELRRSEANLADGQRISHTGSWAWNAASGALFWSVEHFRIFGLDPDTREASTKVGFQMIHPEDRHLVEDIFQNSMREKSEFEVEYRIVRPDGMVRHLCSVGHPVLNESGDVAEYVGTVIDVTDRKRAEEALRITEAELARVSRVLTMGELTASIAHEVNQPLSAVIANSNACMRWLAADSPNLDEARKALLRIVRDGNRASEVIARIQALVQNTGTEKERLDLNLVIQDVVALTRGALRRNGVALNAALDTGLPPVLGDRVQLQQVLLNLIMNGIESMGGLVDRPRALVITTRTDDVDQVRASVQDSGTGLELQRLERVFEPFYTTKANGIGIGLSISRSIIQAHGGRLWVTQNDGPGATFHFTLPIYQLDAA